MATDTLASADLETVTLTNGLTCEMPADSPLAQLLKSQRTWVGPSAKERLKILQGAKTVAIVGASPNATRSSYFVATYLQQSSDYELFFVNPMVDEILGQKTYPDLASLPVVPDIVDVFRKGSDIPSVIDEALAIGAKTVWVQLGIWNQDAAIYGESKGLTVVMDRCIKIEHARFHGGLHLLGFDTGVISSRKGARKRSLLLPPRLPADRVALTVVLHVAVDPTIDEHRVVVPGHGGRGHAAVTGDHLAISHELQAADVVRGLDGAQVALDFKSPNVLGVDLQTVAHDGERSEVPCRHGDAGARDREALAVVHPVGSGRRDHPIDAAGRRLGGRGGDRPGRITRGRHRFSRPRRAGARPGTQLANSDNGLQALSDATSAMLSGRAATSTYRRRGTMPPSLVPRRQGASSSPSERSSVTGTRAHEALAE